MVHPAQRQHLAAIFTCRDVAHRLTLGPHHGALGAQITVGVDFDFHPAIAENPLGHHGHHVDPGIMRGNDERGWFVVGISSAGANRGDKPVVVARHRWQQFAVPFALAPFQNGQHVKAHQFAFGVGIAVAGAAAPFSDVTKHRAGVAADFSRSFGLATHGVTAPLWAWRMAARTLSGVAGRSRIRAPQAS